MIMLLDDAFNRAFWDRITVSQDSLDIANRVRTNLLPWVGQFSPQLVEELLAAHGAQADRIVDPFVGSGTSLVEAARLNKFAIGGDVNPAAAILARVYELVSVPKRAREEIIRLMEERLFRVVPPHQWLESTRDHQTHLESILLDWYHISDQDEERILMEALVVLCDFYSPGLDVERIHRNWNRLAEIVRSLPESDQPVSVHQADARALPLESGSVDLVLTSPPYINVHNYHQKFRRSVEALGWNVLTAALSEIGSNRQNRGNRFLTVIQYSLDMALALREMARIAGPEKRLILVVGRESLVRKVPFFNGRLVAELAVSGVGLAIDRRQERQFVNRYGNKIREDILHFLTFSDYQDEGSCISAARSIASQTLSATRQLTDGVTRVGIDDALERLELVSPSPLLDANHCAQVPA